MTLFFCNNGTLDPRLITTLGTNVKSHSSAIGHFGTGLKYAIAGILRIGGQISITTKKSHWEFGTSREEIRGKEFDIVTMTVESGAFAVSQRLGFTTELGGDWEPWQLYRELRANAEDEGGVIVFEDAPITTAAMFARVVDGLGNWDTVISVDCDALEAAHAAAGEFWLDSTRELLWASPELEIYLGASPYLFYRGMRATSAGRLPWPLTFSFLGNGVAGAELTEDRTLRSESSAITIITMALLKEAPRAVLELIFDAGVADEAQREISFPSWIEPGPNFIELVIERMRLRGKLPHSAREAVRTFRKEAVAKAELAIPEGGWEEIAAAAPPLADEITAYKYGWMSEAESRIAGLETELAYWKAAAHALAFGNGRVELSAVADWGRAEDADPVEEGT